MTSPATAIAEMTTAATRVGVLSVTVQDSQRSLISWKVEVTADRTCMWPLCLVARTHSPHEPTYFD